MKGRGTAVSKTEPAARATPGLRQLWEGNWGGEDGACAGGAGLAWGPCQDGQEEGHGGEAYVCRARSSIRTPERQLSWGAGSVHLTRSPWEDLIFPTVAKAEQYGATPHGAKLG